VEAACSRGTEAFGAIPGFRRPAMASSTMEGQRVSASPMQILSACAWASVRQDRGVITSHDHRDPRRRKPSATAYALGARGVMAVIPTRS